MVLIGTDVCCSSRADKSENLRVRLKFVKGDRLKMIAMLGVSHFVMILITDCCAMPSIHT